MFGRGKPPAPEFVTDGASGAPGMRPMLEGDAHGFPPAPGGPDADAPGMRPTLEGDAHGFRNPDAVALGGSAEAGAIEPINEGAGGLTVGPA